jgi:hypothetical protein
MGMIERAQQGVENVATPRLTIVFAYYENPQMLEFQWKEIAAYPEEMKSVLEVVVVDDGSPSFPAKDAPRPPGLPQVAIFRITDDIRWNQDAARNIGAHEARAPWLLLTDIDHVVPASSLIAILEGERPDQSFYTLGRIKFYGGEARESHPNSYLMTKKLYWDIGGHDEDYAGVYGKDFLFRKRALRRSNEEHLPQIVLARVGTTAVKDAGTTTITRENTLFRRVWGYLLEWLKAMKLWRGVQTLSYPYEKVL